MTRILTVIALALAAPVTGHAQASIDWKGVEAETLQHFRALVQLDTSNPPGNETRAVDYLKEILAKDGIAVEMFAANPSRANLVARIKGNGKKRPILVMGHTDVVTIDAKKWIDHGPFSADVADGYVYGRGTVDDKDNVVASLMLMLILRARTSRSTAT
jgi:acetylornithine deacetylase/succinyl-diaminopimelate desuccinylase-like protein